MIRFPNDCIWGTGKSKGQVFIHVQSDFPFILYIFFNFFYHILTVWLSSDCWMEIGLQSTGPLREFLGPRAKGNLPPSSNSSNNDTQTKSTTVHVISKESVQQKWIDELWFRKQLSTCLFFWTLNYNSWAPGRRPGWPPSQWACQSILKRHFDVYFDIRLLCSHDMILFRKWKPDKKKSCDCTFICAVNILANLCQSQLKFSDWKCLAPVSL